MADPTRRAARAVPPALLAAVGMGACVADTAPTTLANPAAAFCVEGGGRYELRASADGSETGVCLLADGTEVDAWEHFRANAGAG